jgi:hypothetical protein
LYADGKLVGQRQMLLPIRNNDGNIKIGKEDENLIDPK